MTHRSHRLCNRPDTFYRRIRRCREWTVLRNSFSLLFGTSHRNRRGRRFASVVPAPPLPKDVCFHERTKNEENGDSDSAFRMLVARGLRDDRQRMVPPLRTWVLRRRRVTLCWRRRFMETMSGSKSPKEPGSRWPMEPETQPCSPIATPKTIREERGEIQFILKTAAPALG